MAFLYEKIDALKEFGTYAELPLSVSKNLRQSFELRPYQKDVFCNFITYFESRLRQKPTQTLFHMATGSGKTLIMAGLMLYLYKQGYRNFLFFVHLSNIVKKTKENFLNPASPKYLFADEINIGGERIKVKEVSNFQDVDENAINICFSTIQGLHSDMFSVKENALSFDDFEGRKIVMISDEAHHLNASTRNLTAAEEKDNRTWEYTVSRLFQSNPENVLLEFTATCDTENREIKAKYENKIVFNYPLSIFREDKYSKEIMTFRSDSNIIDRCIQAMILSQYRLKLFQDKRFNIKPVVMFKSKTIAENKNNFNAVIEEVSKLTGAKIQQVMDNIRGSVVVMQSAYEYFLGNGISFDQLAQEIKDDFSLEHCISANEDGDVEKNQLMLNSLEELSNPYRAVFAVNKLNEGWDVLNLFDIVRLYETRDGKGNANDGSYKPGKTTIEEAQLIGRGARYCPFQLDTEQPKYQRKFDNDVDNPMRVCETLYYHCWNETRYISELHTALREIGLDLENVRTCHYHLKESFKDDEVYKYGYVFVNERLTTSRDTVDGLLPSVRDKIYNISIATGKGGTDIVMDEVASADKSIKNYTVTKKIKDIAAINYSTVEKALRQFDVFKFSTLKAYFPQLSSTHMFVENEKYLGNVQISLTTKYEKPTMYLWHKACVSVFGKIANYVSSIEETYAGSNEFKAIRLNEIIRDKTVNYTQPHLGGLGFSQSDPSVDANDRFDLQQADWFAFNDNFGTSEEKALVSYFRQYVSELQQKYDKVFLIRNERQLHLYSFDDGQRFEPDYIIYLWKKDKVCSEQIIVFVEPKGTQLLEADSWKENFLLQLEKRAVPTLIFKDDNKYKIWGFHFFNRENRSVEFADDMKRL